MKSPRFEMPDNVVSEEFLGTLRNLSVPNTLANNNSVVEKPSKKLTQSLSFSVGEQLLFIDPVSEKEAYGRVLNDWDFRHGASAPPVLRGVSGEVMYMVHLLGFVSDLGEGGYLELIRDPPVEDEHNILPHLEGFEDAPYRQEGYLATDIDRKLQDIRSIQKYGPRHHLKSTWPQLRPTSPMDPDRSKSVEMLRPEPNDLLKDQPVDTTYMHFQNHLEDGFSMHRLPPLSSIEANPDSPRAANYRRYKHALRGASVSSNLNSDAVDMKEALRLLVVAGSDLTRPIDKHQEIMKAKFGRIRSALERRFMNSFSDMMRWAFKIWTEGMEDLRIRQRHLCARRIQSIARMWMQRGSLRELSDEWQKVLEKKWRLVHLPFGYSTADDPYAVTTDNKMYFRTLVDLNRYSAFLIKMVQKCVKFLERKRRRVLVEGIKKWAKSCGVMSESDIKSSHILEYAEESVEDAMPPTSLQKAAARKVADTLDFFRVGKALDVVAEAKASGSYTKMKQLEDNIGELSYENVFSSPLGFGVGAGPRTTTTDDDPDAEPTVLDPTLPPTHPSVGINLAKLPKLFEPTTAESRLKLGLERLKYFGFGAYTEGPTDSSSWVVPGMLAMGPVPFGKAHKNSSLDSVSSLILAGLGTFVSLLGIEEEKDIENSEGQGKRIEELMKAAHVKAKFSVANVILENEESIAKQNRELINIPVLEPTNIKFAKCKRDRLRCLARINLANENITKTKEQLKKYPKSYDWLRVPMSASSVPTIHQFLPVLWELEARLRRGENLYIYSREGHGRVGVICGALLGRLYGLPAREALYRLQACHDVAKQNFAREVAINCPQLSIQQRLVVQAIDATNRHFSGVTWRCLTNPDNATIETHALVRGSQGGLHSEKEIASVVQWKKEIVRFRTSSDVDQVAEPLHDKESARFPLLPKHPETGSSASIRGGNSTDRYPIYSDGNALSGDLPATANTLQRRQVEGKSCNLLQQRGIGTGLVPQANLQIIAPPIARPTPSGPPRLPLIRLKDKNNSQANALPFNIPSDNQ